MQWADTVLEVALFYEGLMADAIQAPIVLFVKVSPLGKLKPEFLSRRPMSFLVACSDKIVIRNIKNFGEGKKFLGNLVGKFFGR